MFNMERPQVHYDSQAVRSVEDQVDSKLQALDNLDPDDIEKLRQRRLEQMKQAAAKRQEWAKKGHGEYREIFGEKDFFAEMKGEERMVCHFFRENWPCKVCGLMLPSCASRKKNHEEQDLCT